MNNRYGVLIVGAFGHLATTVITGALALKKGLCSKSGMVTALDDFSQLDLIEPGDLIFGGWDIRSVSFSENARNLLREIGFSAANQFPEIEDEVETISANIFPGTTKNCGKAIENLTCHEENTKETSLKEIICRFQDDIKRFKEKNNLNGAMVVNLSSTEPPSVCEDKCMSIDSLNRIIEENNSKAIRASTIYAYAAIDAGCPYINFTPSNGAMLSCLIDLAEKRKVPVMGSDGKTGETLVKSALAPMFACRNLKVLSWEGYNILGNMDGRVLSHPENKSSKIKSKEHILSKILGYNPHTKVSIDYVPSLGDWKTAWDFIHFEGFLNTKMSLQFTWQGCDSALAAPLVLDLIRLAFFASQKGEKGLMKHLACFFKSPIGVEEQNLHEQFRMLKDYVNKHKKVASKIKE